MNQVIDATQNWRFRRGEEDWRVVSLPHTAALVPEVASNSPLGCVDYQYEFLAPLDWKGKPVYFEIGAAAQTARVSLNGEYQFTHFGGYQRFLIPLGDGLKPGELNRLELQLDNRPSGDMAPGKPESGLDFLYHSGLYREARLLVWEEVHLSDELAVERGRRRRSLYLHEIAGRLRRGDHRALPCRP